MLPNMEENNLELCGAFFKCLLRLEDALLTFRFYWTSFLNNLMHISEEITTHTSDKID